VEKIYGDMFSQLLFFFFTIRNKNFIKKKA